MKILYIPLDERPCNSKFPLLHAQGASNIEIISPPINLLGVKKKAANLDKIWNFVHENILNVDYAVLSLDMLLYGGLIPSRLHESNKLVTDKYFEHVKKLKEKNPAVKVIAFQCIMRSPQYNSSEEEPDYYADYGEALHRSAYLDDKEEREGLTESEKIEKKSYQIPNDILKDYETRIQFNLLYNIRTIELVNENLIDFLVIPQDDSSPFGYTALAQKEVLQNVSTKEVENRVRVYPGADEVGSSLVARAFLEYHGKQPKIYTFYSSTLGPQLVPLYEDRPMNESLKSHVEVCGLEWVDNSEEADIILAYNSPGKVMEEAEAQQNKDVTYSSYRNIVDFVKRVKQYSNKGKAIAICDSAYANGGDLDLLKTLNQFDLINSLNGYAGWNTNCNSLGTTLSEAIFSLFKDEIKVRETVYYRIIEDILYQSIVRKNITLNYLPLHDLSYFELKNLEDKVCAEIEKQLNKEISLVPALKEQNVSVSDINLPWSRMFELNYEMTLNG